MPKHYPEKFERDVVAFARSSNLSQREVARDFGISTHSVQRWVKQADVDDGVVDGVSTDDQRELVELRRRTRQLEQENEILRRAAVLRALPPDDDVVIQAGCGDSTGRGGHVGWTLAARRETSGTSHVCDSPGRVS